MTDVELFHSGVLLSDRYHFVSNVVARLRFCYSIERLWSG